MNRPTEPILSPAASRYVALACSVSTLLTASVAADFQPRYWTDDSGQQHRYVLYVPEKSALSGSPPLILFLNGVGQNGNDGLQQARANFGPCIWEKRFRFPFLALFPQCNAGSSWSTVGSSEAERAIAILDAIVDEFDVDEDRIYLTGPSSGGAGVWSVAAAYPDRFAAIAPMCGMLGNKDFVEPIVKARIPVWNYWCIEDNPTLVAFNKDVHQLLWERGLSPLATETGTPDFYHNCWDVGYRTPPLYEWLLRQRKSKNLAQALFQRLDLASGWSGIDGDVWRYVSENDGEVTLEATVSEKPRGDLPLTTKRSFSGAELHFEVSGEGFKGLEISLLAEEDARAATVMLIPPTLGDGGVYLGSERKWVIGLDPVAQATFDENKWNDVRIKLAGQEITADLNGWRLFQASLREAVAGPIRFCLAGAEAGSPIRLRRLRAR
ncbi:MAG: PHB depolymerase family esterase [Pseudomonadota bacterium]